jgi:hypothetical protein
MVNTDCHEGPELDNLSVEELRDMKFGMLEAVEELNRKMIGFVHQAGMYDQAGHELEEKASRYETSIRDLENSKSDDELASLLKMCNEFRDLSKNNAELAAEKRNLAGLAESEAIRQEDLLKSLEHRIQKRIR